MFEDDLLAWHDLNARDLPWRGERDPYKIWISEIMLQQTRTGTVAGYYHTFLQAFPDVFALAEAPEDQVFKKWEGLGYYSRARNLMKAAKIVAGEMGGQMPDTFGGLLRLPGVGEYTAGAIASIAFHRRELAMDGNAVRVLSRVLCESRCVGEAAVKRSLRERGAALMSDRRPGDFNQAIMGLGNMVCVPGHPCCGECPVEKWCGAKKRGVERELPRLPEKPEKKTVSVGVALVTHKNRVLLVRRPEKGILAGLMAFPVFEGARSGAEVRAGLEEMGLRVDRGRALVEAEHVFTHRIWRMKGWLFSAQDAPEEAGIWADARALGEAALPTALKVYRRAAEELLGEDGRI